MVVYIKLTLKKITCSVLVKDCAGMLCVDILIVRMILGYINLHHSIATLLDTAQIDHRNIITVNISCGHFTCAIDKQQEVASREAVAMAYICTHGQIWTCA